MRRLAPSESKSLCFASRSESALGIFVDADGTIQNFDQKADVAQWSIFTMMTYLISEWDLLEIGDLILVIVGAVANKLLGLRQLSTCSAEYLRAAAQTLRYC